MVSERGPTAALEQFARKRRIRGRATTAFPRWGRSSRADGLTLSCNLFLFSMGLGLVIQKPEHASDTAPSGQHARHSEEALRSLQGMDGPLPVDVIEEQLKPAPTKATSCLACRKAKVSGDCSSMPVMVVVTCVLLSTDPMCREQTRSSAVPVLSLCATRAQV